MNEPNNYDISSGEDFEAMTPAEADAAISKTLAEAASDPKHPYMDTHHFQHHKTVERMTKLYEIKCKDQVLPIEQACQEGLDQQVERQNNLVEEAEKEAKLLERLGFDPTEIPDDVQPFQVASLKMQRLNAEEKFEELTPMLEKELRTLNFSGIDTFRSFTRDESIDPEIRAEHIELILKRIYSANKQIYGGKQ